MGDYRDDLTAARERVKALEAERDTDPEIDPTSPVQRFAVQHLAIALTILGAILGALAAWAFGGK